MLETILDDYPKKANLKSGLIAGLRPLRPEDEAEFYRFFMAVPERERMFIKHRVQDPAVIHGWCQDIDLGRNLPLLALMNSGITGVATLHQQLGGWKRHIGRISVLVHPEYRGRGLARCLVSETIEIARQIGLEKLEAEFIGDQDKAIKMFGMLGFTTILRLPDYVKDMQANTHEYVLMGLDLETDEEYASAG